MENKTSFINKTVGTIYILFFIVSLSLVLFNTKSELHIQINQYHNSLFDIFFKYITYFGDGIIFGIAIIIFFFIDKKESLKYVVIGLLTLIIVAVFKKIIFSGLPRPVTVIGEENLHLINGIKIAYKNSFPSGHTTTIFAIIVPFIDWVKSKYIKITLIILAILVGFSRVYLSQHFLLDVLVGSIVGIGIGVLGIYLTDKIYPKLIPKK